MGYISLLRPHLNLRSTISEGSGDELPQSSTDLLEAISERPSAVSFGPIGEILQGSPPSTGLRDVRGWRHLVGEVVGREQELGSLREFVAGSRAGAHAFVLEGEAGIGKTTLWLAGLDAARDRSMRVLSARPAVAESGLAHVGLGDLFEGVLEEMLPAMPAPRRSALEVALLLAEAGARPPDARAVGVAVLTGLRILAESEPLLIAVDDVQWLDASSAAALEFALRRMLLEPALLLLARRSGEAGPVPENALPVERVTRRAVGPLSVGATHRLLLRRLGRTFTRPTLLRLHEVADGNPFFALELARARDRAGTSPAPGDPFTDWSGPRCPSARSPR